MPRGSSGLLDVNLIAVADLYLKVFIFRGTQYFTDTTEAAPKPNNGLKCIVEWVGLDKSPVFANFILG